MGFIDLLDIVSGLFLFLRFIRLTTACFFFFVVVVLLCLLVAKAAFIAKRQTGDVRVHMNVSCADIMSTGTSSCSSCSSSGFATRMVTVFLFFFFFGW